MRNEFLRKRRKEILVIIIVEIDDSLARMKRDNYLLFLRRATLFFHRETFFLAQKCVLFTFLARTSKVLLSSKHTSRAGFFSFRRITRWFSLKRYDFGWLFNLKKKERFGCRVFCVSHKNQTFLLTYFCSDFFPNKQNSTRSYPEAKRWTRTRPKGTWTTGR